MPLKNGSFITTVANPPCGVETTKITSNLTRVVLLLIHRVELKPLEEKIAWEQFWGC